MRLMNGVVLSIAVIAILGCGGGGGGGGGGAIGIVVVNNPDDFSIASGGAAHTSVFSFFWECTDDQANIVLAEGISFGSMRLEILDDASNVVHDNTYEAALLGATRAVTQPGGVPGFWTVRFTFTGCTWRNAITLKADVTDDPDEIRIAAGFNVAALTLVYDVGWGAGPASVDFALGLSDGDVHIRIWDGGGTLVYDFLFVAPMSVAILDATAGGAAGVWTIQIDFTNAVNGGTLVLSHP